jgi:hypothetical protein
LLVDVNCPNIVFNPWVVRDDLIVESLGMISAAMDAMADALMVWLAEGVAAYEGHVKTQRLSNARTANRLFFIFSSSRFNFFLFRENDWGGSMDVTLDQ